MKQIDTRGMSCPQPVLMTKKALAQNPEGFEVLVDNNTSKNNIERFVKNSGYRMDIKPNGDEYIIRILK